jgi:hypothetical protein
MAPTTLELLEIESTLEEIRAHQEAVLLARNYYNGKQDVYLNARALEYLGLHKENPFRFNICRTIVLSLAQELNLLGFGTDEEDDPESQEEASKPVSEWAARVFAENKIDSLQDTIHESAFSDSESFVIVEWDPIEERPKLIYNPYFVDPDAGGDGMGVYMIYENDDPEQRPIAAVKRWIERIPAGPNMTPLSRLRATIYYPDHIERWVFENNGVWEHFIEETGQINEDGEAVSIDWSIPNKDGAGEPLGIPVFHFKNKGLRPEHWDAIPMQDATNKTLVDILAAGDLTAFQSFFGFGFFPTTDGQSPKSDGSNLMKMGPAQFNGTTKKPGDASLQVITGQDSTFLMNQLKDTVLLTAQITDTPASKFVVTAAIASDKTIKEQERGLRKKAKNRRGLFSDPWVGVFDMARKLSNLFGAAGLSEEVSIFPLWDHTETLEELSQKKDALEIPIEQLWREAGYTETQIESMKNAPSFRVEFERRLWEGANAASLNGIPLEHYLERAGLPKDEIAAIVKAIGNQSGVNGENL